MVPFYFPGSPDRWEAELNSGILGNFWPLSPPLELEYAGITSSFNTSEAAYQALKWWRDDTIRAEFETAADGEMAFQTKLTHEARAPLPASWGNITPTALEGTSNWLAANPPPPQSIDKWTAMSLVPRPPLPFVHARVLSRENTTFLGNLSWRHRFWRQNLVGHR